MNTKLIGFVAAYQIIMVRLSLVMLGCIAVWWGIVDFPDFWKTSLIERIASRIVAGDPFKDEILARQLPVIDLAESSTYCEPSAARSAAIVRMRMVETASSSKEHEPTAENVSLLQSDIRRSLSCAPADPFLWLALYWMESPEGRFQSDGLNYLRMSYRLGPNEGWIGIKRSRLALAQFEKLPADLAGDTISEFVGLVESGLFQPAAEIFVDLPAEVRNLILARLDHIPNCHRDLFLRSVDKLEYKPAGK